MNDEWNVRNLKECYKVRRTFNYSMFKFLDENRTYEHAKVVGKSIDKIGLLPIPIVTDEFRRIHDGQGRFIACRQRNLPVYWIEVQGLSMDDTRELNSTSTKWKTGDFIHSYATGVDRKMDYVYLENLQKQFPQFGNVVITYAIDEHGCGSYAPKIRSGEFECDTEMYEQTQDCLTWLSQFVEYVKRIGGKCNYLYTALIWCYKNESIDNDYLLEKFKKYYASIDEIATEANAIKQIQEKIYNFNLRSPREPVFITSDYERFKLKKKRDAKEKSKKCK